MSGNRYYYLGVDPDSHALGWTIIDSEGDPVRVGVAKVPSRLKGVAAMEHMAGALILAKHHIREYLKEHGGVKTLRAVSIETMHYRDRAISADSILMISVIAGMAAGTFADIADDLFLLPADQWTKGVAKDIRQNRALSSLGYEVLIDKGVSARKAFARKFQIPESSATHVLDSLDLARYGQNHMR